MKTLFEKDWTKTFLITSVVILGMLLLLFMLAGNAIGDIFVSTFVISILSGAIYTYLKHFSGKVAHHENQNRIIKKEVEKEEFKNQIDNYNNLKITKSKRGQAALLIVCIMVFMIILALFNFVARDYLYALIIFMPLAYFIYLGNRWAMIVAMAIWTFNGLNLLLNGRSLIPVVIIWWFIFVTFYQALKVENERRKNGSMDLLAKNKRSKTTKMRVD